MMSKMVSFHSTRSLAGSVDKFNFSTASVATMTSSELEVDFRADLKTRQTLRPVTHYVFFPNVISRFAFFTVLSSYIG